MMGVIETDDLGQHVRVTLVGLRTRGGVPFRQRADDIGLIAYT